VTLVGAGLPAGGGGRRVIPIIIQMLITRCREHRRPDDAHGHEDADVVQNHGNERPLLRCLEEEEEEEEEEVV